MTRSHPLELLIPSLARPVPARAKPQDRDGFLRWLAGAEQKQVMRLGWALGLSRDIPELADLWEPDGSHVHAFAGHVPDDLEGLPPSLLLAEAALAPREDASPFVLLREPPLTDTGYLVHFTWNPEALFREGFLGTPDTDGLPNSFRRRKAEPGFNFAVPAGGFDAQNLGADDFYGDDAVLFRARHIPTYNADSDDEEAIFWGPDASPSEMVHLSRSDVPGEGWSVIGVDGSVLYRGGDVHACAVWAIRQEGPLLGALRGERTYAMRACDDHIEEDVAPAFK